MNTKKLNMKKIIIFILLLSFFVNCNNNKSNEDENNKNSDSYYNQEEQEYLFIEGNKIAIKEYPPDGEVIFRLDNGKKCKLLKKGKEQTILGLTDFWYKIEYEGIEGWVFGAQTSEKQINKIVEYNQQLPFNYKVFDFLDELIYYDFDNYQSSVDFHTSLYPIGWSKDGKIAYIEIRREYGVEYAVQSSTSFVIQNLDSDKKLEEINLIFNSDANNSSINIYYENQYDIQFLLDKYNIVKNDKFVLTNKVRSNNHSYTTKIELIEKTQNISDVKILLVRDDGKTKLVKYIKSAFNTNNAERDIYTYILENPHNEIEAIIYVNFENDGMYGTLKYEIIGSNLNLNFK